MCALGSPVPKKIATKPRGPTFIRPKHAVPVQKFGLGGGLEGHTHHVCISGHAVLHQHSQGVLHRPHAVNTLRKESRTTRQVAVCRARTHVKRSEGRVGKGAAEGKENHIIGDLRQGATRSPSSHWA